MLGGTTAQHTTSSAGCQVQVSMQGRALGHEKKGSVMQCWNEERQGAANKASCNHHPKP